MHWLCCGATELRSAVLCYVALCVAVQSRSLDLTNVEYCSGPWLSKDCVSGLVLRLVWFNVCRFRTATVEPWIPCWNCGGDLRRADPRCNAAAFGGRWLRDRCAVLIGLGSELVTARLSTACLTSLRRAMPSLIAGSKVVASVKFAANTHGCPFFLRTISARLLKCLWSPVLPCGCMVLCMSTSLST